MQNFLLALSYAHAPHMCEKYHQDFVNISLRAFPALAFRAFERARMNGFK